MKKAFILLLLVVIFFCGFVIFAAAEAEQADALIENSGIYDAAEELDRESRDFLESIGFESVTSSALYALDFGTVLKSVGERFLAVLQELSRTFLSIFAAVLVCALADNFSRGFQRADASKITGAACTVFLGGICMVPLSGMMTALGVAVESATSFGVAIVPILCTITVAQGKTLGAAVFNGSAVALGEVVSTLCSTCFMPLSYVLLAIGFMSAVAEETRLDKLNGVVRKYLMILLGTLASIYFSVLGLKAKLGAAADASALKAVKLTAGSFLPVIGSAVSESAGVIVASLSLTKTAIGGFAVAALAGIFLPLILKSVLWYGCLESAAFVAELFGLGSGVKVLKSLAGTVSIMAVMVIFCALVFILNFGLILGAGG